MIRRLLIVAMAVLLCTSAFGPAVVAGTGAGAAQTQEESTTNDSVRVTTGAQLSTIVTATSNEVRTEFENAAFEERLNRSDGEARAAAIADRVAALENRSATLQAEYEEATAAYEAGDIDESSYAQRLASVNARAQGVVSSYDRLLERADDVSPDALDAANVSASELREQREAAAQLTSTGTDALRRQFTGEASGEAEIEIETNGGVSIEAETEDGERSREFERPHDGGSLEIPQADAREAALDALSAANGSWTLEEASSDADDGVYEFEFELTGAASGEAEVSIDGETGTVFALEEEIEGPDAGDEDEGDDEAPDIDDERDGNDAREDNAENGSESERENDDEREDERENEGDDDAALETDATVENGTVTVTVTHNDSSVAGASVVANDESVGTTGDDGTISFAVPDGAAELEIDVTDGDREAELELDLEDGDRDAAEADEEQPDDGEDDDDEDDEDEDDEDEDDEPTDRSAN